MGTKKKDLKDKLPMGAPSKFIQAKISTIELLARRGFTDAEIAEVLEVDESTFHNWKKDHPDFFESLKDWKREADDKVVKALFERATGFSHKETKFFCHEGMIITEDTIKHYPPDATSMIFWLKNRNPGEWRDKVENINLNLNSEMTVEDFIKNSEGSNGKKT